MDKHNVYESDDEYDPYASAEESSDSVGSARNSPAPETGESLKRTISEPEHISAKKIRSKPKSGDTLLTEEDIVFHLKEKPLRAKDLILLLKTKLKAHPDNKDRFRMLVKKVAVVKSDAGGEKLLELQQEFV